MHAHLKVGIASLGISVQPNQCIEKEQAFTFSRGNVVE